MSVNAFFDVCFMIAAVQKGHLWPLSETSLGCVSSEEFDGQNGELRHLLTIETFDK